MKTLFALCFVLAPEWNGVSCLSETIAIRHAPVSKRGCLGYESKREKRGVSYQSDVLRRSWGFLRRVSARNLGMTYTQAPTRLFRASISALTSACGLILGCSGLAASFLSRASCSACSPP